MNVKIKANNVHCLLNNYEKMYSDLKELLSDDDFIFTKRTPGAGFLQWDLPREGWIPLSDVDPLVAIEVNAEKEKRFASILSRLDKNRTMVQKALTVPKDDFIFYKPASDGTIRIMITVWGYKYPEIITNKPLVSPPGEIKIVQEVEVSFLYDDIPLPNYEFKINGFSRKSAENGKLLLGELPVGNVYEIETSTGRKVNLEVKEGQRDFAIDITHYVEVKVEVTKDNTPLMNTDCRLNYCGRETKLTTDVDGKATTTLVLDRNASDCTVIVESIRQQKPLQMPSTQFEFKLETPAEPSIQPDNVPEKPEESQKLNRELEPPNEAALLPIDEPKQQIRSFCPIVKIEGEQGFIGKTYPICVTIGDHTHEYVSDNEGLVHLSSVLEGEQMVIADMLLADNVQSYLLNADQDIYIFNIPYTSSDLTNDIKIIVQDENGHPMNGANLFFSQDGHPNTLIYLNEDGTAYLGRKDYESRKPLSVVLTFNNEKYDPVVFELADDENEYLLKAVAKTSIGNRLLEILMTMLGFTGVCAVYFLTMKMLFA